jgi:hypothetical protein
LSGRITRTTFFFYHFILITGGLGERYSENNLKSTKNGPPNTGTGVENNIMPPRTRNQTLQNQESEFITSFYSIPHVLQLQAFLADCGDAHLKTILDLSAIEFPEDAATPELQTLVRRHFVSIIGTPMHLYVPPPPSSQQGKSKSSFLKFHVLIPVFV